MQFRPSLEPVPYEDNTDTIKIDEMERKTESFLRMTDESFQKYVRENSIIFDQLPTSEKNKVLNTFLESVFPDAPNDMKKGIKVQLFAIYNKE